jgi:hypothetical protein
MRSVCVLAEMEQVVFFGPDILLVYFYKFSLVMLCILALASRFIILEGFSPFLLIPTIAIPQNKGGTCENKNT